MSWYIKRPIEGISLNGYEYLLDDDGYAMEFQSYDEARNYLLDYADEEDIDADLDSGALSIDKEDE